MAIKVFTDSTSYISETMLQAFNIRIISLSVVFEDEIIEEYGASNEAFYKKMDSVNYFPTSSQPSIEVMYKAFEEEIKKGNEIVGVFISSEMSGTYQSAMMIKNQLIEEYPNAKIEIVDSKANCMELGFQAISAAKVAKAGGTIEEAVYAAKETKKRSRFIFTPSTLDYLRKGGRIGLAKALLGNVLKLKPILTVKEGHTTPVTSVRTRTKSLSKIIELFDEDVKHFGLTDVVIHHINCEDDARDLADQFEAKIGMKVDIISIGPVVGVHVGPGALGIVYVTKDERVESNPLEKLENMVKENFDTVKESIDHMTKKK